MATKTGIANGNSADFVSLRAPNGDLKDDAVLNSWLFANGTQPDSVWVEGHKQVEGGRHQKRDEISAKFRSVMRALVA